MIFRCYSALASLSSGRSRQNGTLGVRILALELVANLLHCDELDSLVTLHVLNESLMHEKDMGPAGDIWVDCHWEDELVILVPLLARFLVQVAPDTYLAIHVVKVVPPNILNITGIDEPMAV